MNDFELEDVLIEHFRLVRESDRARESEIPIERLAKLPPQIVRLRVLTPVLLDWKLDLARARLVALAGCAVAGLTSGIFYPPLTIRTWPHVTAIAYAMQTADSPADPE